MKMNSGDAPDGLGKGRGNNDISKVCCILHYSCIVNRMSKLIFQWAFSTSQDEEQQEAIVREICETLSASRDSGMYVIIEAVVENFSARVVVDMGGQKLCGDGLLGGIIQPTY